MTHSPQEPTSDALPRESHKRGDDEGSVPTIDLPNHRYYRACHGAWRSPLSITVTDRAALRRSGMPWADRVNVRMMAVWPRWLGRFQLETTVAYAERGEVVHTTVVRWLGLALLRSVETITLAPDGTRFSMTGEQRMAPAVWARRTMSGSGTIDPAGRAAQYEFLWLGARLRQATVREDDLVSIDLEGPGFRGVQRLVRIDRAP